MLSLFEDLVEKRRLFVEFVITEEALKLCGAAGVANPMRVEKDRETEMYHVRFSLPELNRYVNFVCRHVGLTIRLDGNVVTKDGLIINRPMAT